MLKDFGLELFDIVIQAGQSNSAGYGLGDATAPYAPDDRTWFLHGDRTISIACETVSGNRVLGNFVISFAERYIQEGFLATDRKLLILRAAAGGTGFSDHRWEPGGDLQVRMMDMMATALGLNAGNRVVAMLWHQGETDAINQVDFQTHYDNLRTLVGLTREAAGEKDLPFIAGDFVEDWKSANETICRPIADAIRAVCAETQGAGFVESNGLQSNDGRLRDGDTIHFCREALYELGRRYFDKYRQITSDSSANRKSVCNEEVLFEQSGEGQDA